MLWTVLQVAGGIFDGVSSVVSAIFDDEEAARAGGGSIKSRRFRSAPRDTLLASGSLEVTDFVTLAEGPQEKEVELQVPMADEDSLRFPPKSSDSFRFLLRCRWRS